MRAKLDYAEGLIDLRRREGLSAAVRETATQRGKHLMDMVRAQVAKVTATEIGERDRLAARRAAEERRDEVVIYAVLVTTQLLSLIAGGLLFWRARRRDAALIHRATPETVGPGIVFLDAEGRPAAAPP
jgi:CHASE3 domain sensor protein